MRRSYRSSGRLRYKRRGVNRLRKRYRKLTKIRVKKKTRRPKQLKQIYDYINSINPVRKMRMQHFYSVNSVINKCEFNSTQSVSGTIHGCSAQLNEVIDFIKGTDAAHSAMGYTEQHFVHSIKSNWRIMNPGNNDIKLDVWILKPTRKGLTSQASPTSFMSNCFGDGNFSLATVAGARLKIAYEDLLQYPGDAPGFYEYFKVESTKSRILKPEQVCNVFAISKPKRFRAEVLDATTYTAFTRFCLIRVQGVCAADTGGANIGIPPASVHVQLTTYLKGRKVPSSYPVIGQLQSGQSSAAAGIAASTYTNVNAAATINNT